MMRREEWGHRGAPKWCNKVMINLLSVIVSIIISGNPEQSTRVVVSIRDAFIYALCSLNNY